MKKLAVLFCFFISVKLASGQCPPGAFAIHVNYIYQYGEPPVNFDTLCWVTVTHFPALSKVYIYDNSAVLRDSLLTDATGHGTVHFTPSTCLVYIPGGIVGTAVSGACTTGIASAGLLAIHLKTFSVTTIDNKVTAAWQLEDESKNISYDLQESMNGVDFHTIYTIKSNMSSTPGKQYQYSLPQTITGKRFYRLKVTEATGPIFYSPIKTASSKEYRSLDVFPAIGKGNFSITVSDNFIGGQLQLFNIAGAVIQSRKITTSVSNIVLNAGTGIYHIRVMSPGGSVLVKTIIVQ